MSKKNQLIDQTFQMEVEENEIMISQGFPREKEGGTEEKSGLLFFHPAPSVPAS